MKKMLLGFVCAVVGTGFAATPAVSSVTVRQNAAREVTVSYTLAGTNAIVTAEMFTNGAPVAAQSFTRLVGDVNRLVQAGSRSFTWYPDRELPEGTSPSTTFSAKLTAWSYEAPPDYMVIDLMVSNTVWHNAQFYASTNDLPFGGLANDIYRTSKLVLRKIPAAGVESKLGACPAEWGYVATNETPRLVTFSRDFWMGIYEVTQRQYYYMTDGQWHSVFRNADCSDTRPAENVSITQLRGSVNNGAYDWPQKGHDVSPTSALGKFRARTGLEFDLPTASQWEYACRGGVAEAIYTGYVSEEWDSGKTSSRPELLKIAWTPANWQDDPVCKSNETHRVGLLVPNDFGLYDMLGNVMELCLDKHDSSIVPPAEPETDPVGPLTVPGNGDKHHIRGGNFLTTNYNRFRPSAVMDWANVGWPGSNGTDGNNRGFRLCCPVGTPD